MTFRSDSPGLEGTCIGRKDRSAQERPLPANSECADESGVRPGRTLMEVVEAVQALAGEKGLCAACTGLPQRARTSAPGLVQRSPSPCRLLPHYV